MKEKRYLSILYKLIAVTAYVGLSAPVIAGLIFSLSPETKYITTFFFNLILTIAGCAVKALCSKLTSCVALRSSDPEENIKNFFQIKHIVLPTIFFVIFGILAYNNQVANLKSAGEYIRYSLLPTCSFLIVFFSMLYGAVLWLFPYDKLISRMSIRSFSLIFLIEFLFSHFTEFISLKFIIFCFFVSVVFILLLLYKKEVKNFILNKGKISKGTKKKLAVVLMVAIIICFIVFFFILSVLSKLLATL